MNMKRSLSIGSVLMVALALAGLTALPAAAQEEASACLLGGWAQITATGLQPQAEDQARGDGGTGGVEAQATCVADCDDGSTVTCWGTSCSAHDANCSNDFAGYCTGTTTGRRDCPVCPQGCSATAQCAGGPPVSCTGSSCFALDNCYAYCDGVHYYCDPPPPYFCPEMN